MTLGADALKRLSSLLDAALDLPEGAARDRWFAGLRDEDATLAPTLRELLARRAAPETGDLIGRPPAFTLPRAAVDGDEFHAGETIGPYRLERRLGRGGMGEVWLAERADGHLKRRVALKLPVLSMRRSVLVQRFARERDILGALAHPNIARLYDAGVGDDGQPFLALEYVEGEPITAWCDGHRLDARERVAMMRQVLDAVRHAHANLVIHRDLKPSNVLVTPDGRAMLLDFGIAKLLQDEGGQAAETELTRLSGRALTPDYAAPEQITGAAISTATDVYALGLLTYELLAGRRPFHGSTRGDLERAVLSVDPARPSQVEGGVLAKSRRDAAPDLDAIVLKALKKRPEERYATVDAFAADLDRWLAGEPVLAQHDSALYRARKFVARHRVGVTAGVLVAALLVTATTVSLWQASIARREARIAQAVEAFMTDVFAANRSQQQDPAAARNTTARELLDRGAERVDAALADVPEARTRVLGTLADMYAELALQGKALELRRKQVAALREIEPATSDRLATAIARQAQAATTANEIDEARRGYAEALRIMDARGDDASVERGFVESSIAYLHMMQGADGGLDHARRAVTILRRHPPTPELVTALQRFAFLAFDKGETDASVAAVREGLAIAPTLGERGLEAIAALTQELGRLQLAQHAWQDAEASMRRAWDESIRRHGPESPHAVNHAIDAGQISFQQGLYRRARDVYEVGGAAAESLLAKGNRTWYVALALGYRGAARAMTGSLDDGLADLQRAIGVREAMDAHPPVAVYLQELLADAWIERGDYVRAAETLDASETLVAKQAGGNPRAQPRRAFARLRLAQALGESDEVRRLIAVTKLEEPVDPKASTAAEPGEHPDDAARRLTALCEARLAAGDPEAALADARRVLENTQRSANAAYHRDRERRASLVAGKALITLGRPGQAIEPLRRSVALGLDPLDIAGTFAHADALTALATALAGAGARDEALQRLREAQAIHSRQGQVPRHYRLPLARLEERLGAVDRRSSAAR